MSQFLSRYEGPYLLDDRGFWYQEKQEIPLSLSGWH
jgi:hypothetical protein